MNNNIEYEIRKNFKWGKLNDFSISTTTSFFGGQTPKLDEVIRQIKHCSNIESIKLNGYVIYYKQYEDLKEELDSNNLEKRKIVKV